MADIKLIRTDSADPDFIKLVGELDVDLRIRDGSEHSFYAQFNKLDTIKNVVVAYNGSEAVGCGAFKPYENNAAEIKRMYVPLHERGKGIAGKILNELEKWASEKGFTSCILETGKKQPEAIRLYEKSGYTFIPNYGQYEGIENSICMKKAIG